LQESPAFTRPEALPPHVREKYPISVELTVDGGKVLSVEVGDLGLGMTPEIVRDYFLQIGRSWYRSAEFAKTFSFNSTSRFGIGFLSVFAVSDDVDVVTRWHGDERDQALRLNLPGPRSHLLMEDTSRNEPGTSVIVRLRHGLSPEAMMRFLRATCVANEFEVVVTSNDADLVPDVSLPRDFSDSASRDLQVASSGGIVKLHEVVSETPDVTGNLQFYKTVAETGTEDWSLKPGELERSILGFNPLSTIPQLPKSWIALNGLSSGDVPMRYQTQGSFGVQFDVRSAASAGEAGLDRERRGKALPWSGHELAKALNEHLAATSRPFPYAALLEQKFRSLASDWSKEVPILMTLSGAILSQNDINQTRVLIALTHYNLVSYTPEAEAEAHIRRVVASAQAWVEQNKITDPVILSGALGYIEGDLLEDLLSFATGRAHDVDEGLLLVEVIPGGPSGLAQEVSVHLLEADSDSDLVRFTYGLAKAVVMSSHPLVQEIREIPEQHVLPRRRLLSNLRSSAYEDDFERLLEDMAGALHNSRLMAYSKYFQDGARPEHFMSISSRDTLRLPHVAPNVT
jgi:hypothetical protein